jgi:hypothetical protein
MVTPNQTETNLAAMTVADTSTAGALAELDASELDQCAGGANMFGNSLSGFSRNRMSFGNMTFAGPEGAGTMKFFDSEEISSFAQEMFGASQ